MLVAILSILAVVWLFFIVRTIDKSKDGEVTERTSFVVLMMATILIDTVAELIKAL